MENNMLMFDYTNGPSYGQVFKIDKLLCDKQSKYQRITVFDTPTVGRILMLNFQFNISTIMEHFYHEPIAHIPIAMIKSNSPEILIIGGGDFGVARHVLKHQHIKNLVLCEIDGEVIEVCKEFFPEWAECVKDKRFKVYVEDGFKYLKECKPESLDAVIIDSTDPFLEETASVLVSEEFYANARHSLKSDGVIIQIISDSLLYPDIWAKIIPKVKKSFDVIAPVFLPIPFYITGSWGLILAGKDRKTLDPALVSDHYLSGIKDLSTMTSDMVKGWFSLPPYIQKIFKGVL